MSPCSTPATMSKYSVSPSGDRTFRSDFHIIDSLLIAVHAFVNLVSMSFSVDETLLPR